MKSILRRNSRRPRKAHLLSWIVAAFTLVTASCGDDSDNKEPVEPKAHIYGRVLEADTYHPLEGVSIQALLTDDQGKEYRVEETTDADGRFHLGLPLPGRWVVTATDPDYTFGQRAVVVAENDRASTQPMYLTPVDPAVISLDGEGGTGENSDGSMAIDVPPGALSRALDIRLTRYTHGWNLPNALPEASHFTYACDLTPTAQAFDQPVTIRIRNDRGFEPGTPVPVGVYDTDSATWKHESMGTISEDGQWVVFEVEHFSARDANLGRQSPGSRPRSLRNRSRRRRRKLRNRWCSSVPAGSLVGVADGHLTVRHWLPGRRIFGRYSSRRLEYDSGLDKDMVWLAASYDITETGTEPPERIRFVAEIGGNRWEYFRRPIEAPMTFGIFWDGTDPMGDPLPAGTYHYKLTISNEYRATFAEVAEFGGEPVSDTGIEADELAQFPTVIEGDIDYVPSPPTSDWTWAVGWRLTDTMTLHESESEVTITTGDHSLFGFDLQDGTYLPWEGDHSSLTKESDGWTWTQSCGCKHSFDAQGRLVSRTDADGRTTTYSYDDQGRLVGIEDPDGGRTTIVRDADGWAQSLTDPVGKTTTFERDDRGDLVRIENPDGSTRTFTYDDAHHLVTQTDAAGRTTTYTYNELGSVIRVDRPDGSHTEHGTLLQETTKDATTTPIGMRDGAGGWHEFWPNEYGTRSAIVEPEGRLLIMQRNDDDQTVRLVWPVAGDDPAKISAYGYDERGRMVEATGPEAEGEFDQPDNLLIAYDDQDRPTTVTHEPIGTWQLEYQGESRRPSLETLPDGRTLSATYDENNEPTAILVGQRAYSFGFDTRGNLDTATTPEGRQWTLERDDAGNITTITDPEGRTTTMTYDDWNMLLSLQLADSSWTFQYAPGCGQDSPARPAGPQVLTAVTGPTGATTHFEYDGRDRLVSMTDPLGNSVTLTYDGEGRLISRTLPGLGTVQYRRNRDGAIVEETMSTGGTITYTYEPNTGRLRSASGPVLDLQVEYDQALRVDQISYQFSDGFEAMVEHDYPDETDMSRRASVWVDGTQWPASFEYDEETNPLLPKYIFGSESWGLVPEYDESGVMTRWESWLAQVETFLTYDMDANLTRARYFQKDGPLLWDLSFAYSDAGLLIGIGTSDGTAQLQYDDMGRLTAMTHPEAVLDDEAFTYDSAGNPRIAGIESEYQYDEAHQLLEDPQYRYTYDESGNRRTRTSKSDSSVTTYDYDAAGRLTSVTLPSGTRVEYVYDPFGRRIERIVDDQVTHHYVWAIADVLAEFDGDGRIMRTYPLSLAPDSMRGMSFIDVSDTSTDYYFALAPDGTVLAMVDEDGNPAGSYHYTAWGKPVGLPADPVNTRLFAGMDYDPITGLYYARNRFYDPETGTFLQRDPIPIKWAMSPYRFANWTYWNDRDPSGLSPVNDVKEAGKFVWKTAGKPALQNAAKEAVGMIPIVGPTASQGLGSYLQLKELLDILRSDNPMKKAIDWFKGFSPAGKYVDSFLSMLKEKKKPTKPRRRFHRKRRHDWASCRHSIRIFRAFHPPQK